MRPRFRAGATVGSTSASARRTCSMRRTAVSPKPMPVIEPDASKTIMASLAQFARPLSSPAAQGCAQRIKYGSAIQPRWLQGVATS